MDQDLKSIITSFFNEAIPDVVVEMLGKSSQSVSDGSAIGQQVIRTSWKVSDKSSFFNVKLELIANIASKINKIPGVSFHYGIARHLTGYPTSVSLRVTTLTTRMSTMTWIDCQANELAQHQGDIRAAIKWGLIGATAVQTCTDGIRLHHEQSEEIMRHQLLNQPV